jgi:fatty-acyl-CoA synthase
MRGKPVTVVWQALDRAAKSAPEKTAYFFLGRQYTFRAVDEQSDRLASGLLRLGLRKADRIGVIALNQPEWVITYFAAAKIGATVVGLNVRYRETELNYMLNQSESKAVVCLAALGDLMDYVGFFDRFRSKVPSVEHFIFIGGQGFEGSRSFDALANAPTDRPALEAAKASVRPEDVMMIIYTSGTTGIPKGAAVTNGSQLAAARAQAEHTRVGPEDLVQVAAPLNHVGGITCGILTMMLAGGAVELIPVFDPNVVIERANANPPTVMAGVPTMHVLLLMNDKFGSMNRERVRLVITGGSNAEPSLLESLYKAFPQATIMNLYGLSESSGALVMSPWDCDFGSTVKSIGKPIGGFQVKVADKEGRELPQGEIGELHFRGEAIAAGYFRMPGETAAVFDAEGWLHTGDLGYLDEKGYIVLMGRLKEMYLQGGFNVYPVEVENLISKHPKVALVAGIGVPDPVLGEIGRYYIVPKPGEEVGEEEIKAYCRERLADYKVPKQVVFRAELPMTPVGKILKSKLKEESEGCERG